MSDAYECALREDDVLEVQEGSCAGGVFRVLKIERLPEHLTPREELDDAIDRVLHLLRTGEERCWETNAQPRVKLSIEWLDAPDEPAEGWPRDAWGNRGSAPLAFIVPDAMLPGLFRDPEILSIGVCPGCWKGPREAGHLFTRRALEKCEYSELRSRRGR